MATLRDFSEYILPDHYDHTGTLASLRSRLKAPLAIHLIQPL
jgi:hypothetical protein